MLTCLAAAVATLTSSHPSSSRLTPAALLALGLLATTTHAALPDCTRPARAQVPVLQDAGMLEALIFDNDGRLIYSDMSSKTVKLIASKGAEPVVLATSVATPGGLALGAQRDLYVGAISDILTPFFPTYARSNVMHVDLDTGKTTPYASGLSMANGIVRAKDGTLFASDDLASSLDRILPNGTVQRTWLAQQGNGMALSVDERTLYVNQTWPAKIVAVDLPSGTTRTLLDTPPGEYWAALDGLTIDASTGTLYAAAYLAGAIWQITPNGQACVLARGLKLPSAVAFGRPEKGFSASSLYVTTHSGSLLELPNVLPER